jgi:hypothetical protein
MSTKTMNEHPSSFYKSEISNIIFKVTLQIPFDSFSYNF